LAKYNGENIKVSAKYIQKKHVGQKTIEKKCILGKIQWRKHKGFGKIHTKKKPVGQKTIEKKCILGKIQWRKHKGFGKIHTKKTCWAKNNREKMHSGQNTMEKT